MPGRSGVTVVTTLVCLFYFACEAAGASSARYSLRPLSKGQDLLATLGRSAPRECGSAALRHCEERKRRSNPRLLCCAMDCFADPVIGRAFARPVGSQ